MRIVLTAWFLLLLSGFALGAELNFSGFVDTYQGLRVTAPVDFLSSRTRVRLEGKMTHEDVMAFVSVNAVYNHVVTSETGINLREAYIDYANDWMDFRIGQQIIIWGRSDGFQISDIISPKDYSEFFARDFDDMRIPVSALKLRFMADIVTFEIIWIPVFSPSIIPYKQDGVTSQWSNNPWAYTLPSGVTINDTVEPPLAIESSEVAGKISISTSAIDIAVFGFYTWADDAAMHYNSSTFTITPKHHRLAVFGLDMAVPVSAFVFRLEAAYNLGRYVSESAAGAVARDTVAGLLGIDWNPGSGWSVSMQFYDVFITNYYDLIENDENTMYLTFSLSKKLLRETLVISTMFFFGINHLDLYNRTSVDYALTDALHLTLGVDWFLGTEGLFGTYSDNNQVFLKVKFSF